jgi:phosphoribosylformylglycinamidine synthase
MKSAVIIFPGSNCDRDAACAIERVTGKPAAMVWHKDTALPDGTGLVVLPGGFSYGDYLRCGAMAALSPIMSAVRAHAERGGYVLGICNGFQVLTESHLLPGALIRNEGLAYLCKDVDLAIANGNTSFTRAYREARDTTMPIGHGEGRFVADAETLDRLEGERLDARHRRHRQRTRQCPRPHAAPGPQRRSRTRAHGRMAPVGKRARGGGVEFHDRRRTT